MTAMIGCLPCELEDSAAGAVLFRDERWSCEVAAGYEVPGWYILRVRRHAEGWNELTADELAEFGGRCAQLSAAIKKALAVEFVYFMSFGENFSHFHFLVIPRGGDIPPESRGAGILKLRDALRDMPAALASLQHVRAALDLPPAGAVSPPSPASS
ncbi:hypothetical protein ABLG96_10895 [Nakamurella sp. A5-74]|uniref:Diadenosine tetraphosphate hydrolase n=1 Tax=Nakamurella sp. A5-74 TaxID=3158264 RepID=A0AAU8DHW6_9ACTN